VLAARCDDLRIEPAPQSSLRLDETQNQSERASGFLAIPAGWQPWWRNALHDTLLARPERLEITADAVSMGSLVNSAQIKVLRDIPAIQETAVAEACAQFDFRSFMESKFIDTSEPVGSTLTTGGPPRYLDQN